MRPSGCNLRIRCPPRDTGPSISLHAINSADLMAGFPNDVNT
jgi:hypothetical protein